ncbi:hypothetical protein N9444_05575 [Gammaproteobacteria bacterium]|nr:hypothetical protein [Gammaproteobacteria bacterium]
MFEITAPISPLNRPSAASLRATISGKPGQACTPTYTKALAPG